MIPLAADGAVAFIKHRIEKFRLKREPYCNIQWLPKYGLFPFEENDIRSAFASGAILVDDEPYISLRQFNRTVARMIAARLKGLNKEFDIAEVTEVGIEKHLIRLMDDYKELMKVA